MQLIINFSALFNPEKSEEPKFECIIENGSTNERLACVQGQSKKIAKTIASEAALIKLWKLRLASNKLHPEDQKYLDEHPKIREFLLNATENDSIESLSKLMIVPSEPASKISLPVMTSFSDPIYLTVHEKQNPPVMILNQLHSQGKLHVCQCFILVSMFHDLIMSYLVV